MLKRATRLPLLASLFGIASAEPVIKTIDYHGWKDAIELRNETTRVVLVPSIGRIMHYSFTDGENLLYLDPTHAGHVNPKHGPAMIDGSPGWIAYGGDRVWPSEEDRFEEINGARRPPDWFFDGIPWTARIDGQHVVIESEVSEFCGAKAIRRISLAPDSSRVSINQRLEKVNLGKRKDIEPIPLTIWNISTLRLPEQILFPLNPKSCFKQQVFIPVWPDVPNRGAENIHREDGLGVFLPNQVDQKVGADAPGWIAAIVDNVVIVESFTFNPKALHPDGGTSVTAYLNPSIGEIECLSPLVKLNPGESIEHTITWDLGRLKKGTLKSERAEARQWIETLHHPPSTH